ncbi:MAG TPA: hypothetical protein ENI23_02190 [bacterium]|nr:hypothetical protein [bacterium]
MVRTVRISDLDDNYEEACQKLLWHGVAWIKNKPFAIWDQKKTDEIRKNIKSSRLAERLYGAEATLKDLDELWDEIVPKMAGDIKNDVKEHLKSIHRQGYYHWINKIGRANPEKVYELDLNKLKTADYHEFDFGTEGPTIT